MVVSMSDKEFSRLNILLDVQARRLRVDDAMQLLGLKRRCHFCLAPTRTRPRGRRAPRGALT
jgi:hypothetical protein